jgi:hypothetical protein
MQNSRNENPLYGYLFVHFIGEQENGEQIYFALSQDGMHWEDLNNQQPVLFSTIGERGVRDPFLLRSADGSRFFLLATDLSIYHRGGWKNSQSTITGSRSIIVWQSNDLMSWSAPRMIEVASAEAGCVWAPEAIYDDVEQDYLVFWATSRLTNDGKGRGMHIYCNKTRDFHSFTEEKMYITRGEENQIIDTTIIKSDGKYYRASGDGHITIEASERLMGEWQIISTLESLGLQLTGHDVEGPIFFKFNGDEKWALLVDQYGTGKGYLPIITTDIGDTTGESWNRPLAGEYSFDTLKKRHGTILPITKSEYDALLAKWGRK